mmetsp:Transcript_9923/g.18896  ORF Transcript_9923/g.18896 Transcript_9923/m.18896 type:complete len:111 (+) Transcript_9923:1134-1466(+)
MSMAAANEVVPVRPSPANCTWRCVGAEWGMREGLTNLSTMSDTRSTPEIIFSNLEACKLCWWSPGRSAEANENKLQCSNNNAASTRSSGIVVAEKRRKKGFIVNAIVRGE